MSAEKPHKYVHAKYVHAVAEPSEQKILKRK